jgi:hypothetical protein
MDDDVASIAVMPDGVTILFDPGIVIAGHEGAGTVHLSGVLRPDSEGGVPDRINFLRIADQVPITILVPEKLPGDPGTP